VKGRGVELEYPMTAPSDGNGELAAQRARGSHILVVRVRGRQGEDNSNKTTISMGT